MGMIQPLPFGASQAEWDSWMTAMTQWANNVDTVSAGLPVTKQGVDNLMQMSGSTSNAFLLYFVSSLPPSPSYPNQVVYNGEDGRIYAWNATTSSWEPTGATAFDQLTGFLQAGQLLLGNQLNICTNGCFTFDTVGQAPNGWSATSSVSNSPVVVEAGGSSPAGCPTANCIYVQGRDTYFTAGQGFDVKAGDSYFLEAYTGSDGTTPGMNVGLYFPAVGANGPQWSAAIQIASGLSGWVTSNGAVIVPAWANRANVWLQVNASAAPWGNNWFTGIECVKSTSTLQTASTGAISLPANTAVTIFTGSFATSSATVILCQGVYNNQNNQWASANLVLLVDGVALINRELFINIGSSSGALAGLPFDVSGVVTTAGNHTFEIQVTNNIGTVTPTYQIESLIVLNLLR